MEGVVNDGSDVNEHEANGLDNRTPHQSADNYGRETETLSEANCIPYCFMMEEDKCTF